MGKKPKLDLEKTFEARYLLREVHDKARLSTRDISKRFEKDYGIQIDHTNIGRAVLKLERELSFNESLKAQYDAWVAREGETGKVFYKTDPISNKVTSDFPTVQKYIADSVKYNHGYVDNLKRAEKCWLFLDKKDPANWTDDDVEKFFVEGRMINRKPFTYPSKFSYKVACRAVAPLVFAVKNGTLMHKQNIKKYVPIVKSPIFLKEFQEIIASDKLTTFEKFVFKLHCVLGSREGSEEMDEIAGRDAASLVGMQWEDYDPRSETMRVFESKAVGWWNNIPLRKLSPFFDAGFADEFKRYWESKGKPRSGLILELGGSVNERYRYLTTLYAKIKRSFPFLQGQRFTPHFGRKTHSNILAEQDVDPLFIIGDADANEGWFGCGETDLDTYRRYYIAIAKQRLDKEYAKAGKA